MALSSQDMVDVRRHTGYGAFGSSGNVSLMYFRYFPSYNSLEYRLNNLTDEEVSVIQDNYLPKITQLENDLYTMREAMIVESAAVFHRNMDEASDRISNLTFYKKLLLSFLQLPPGPFFVGSSACVRMVV
jgi:hypothetical protein